MYNKAMTKEKLIEAITPLITEDVKNGAKTITESDRYTCYTWDDYSHVIKDYCNTQQEFYELLAKGNPEELANFIEKEMNWVTKFYIRNIENAGDWN